VLFILIITTSIFIFSACSNCSKETKIKLKTEIICNKGYLVEQTLILDRTSNEIFAEPTIIPCKN
jgi:hypothetical protein